MLDVAQQNETHPLSPAESTILKKDDFGGWGASIDGGRSILPLPEPLGTNLAALFAAQEGRRSPFLRALKDKWPLLNCRKTIALAKGVITPEQLGSMQGPAVEHILQTSGFSTMDAFLDFERSDLAPDPSKQLHDTDGVLDLMRAIRMIQDDPAGEIRIESDGGESLMQYIEELEELSPGLFPLEVHIFHPLPEYASTIAQKVRSDERVAADDFYRRMHRNHSFIALGRDSAGHLLCAHKGSAQEYDEVTVMELATVVRWGFSIEREGDHLIALGPIQM